MIFSQNAHTISFRFVNNKWRKFRAASTPSAYTTPFPRKQYYSPRIEGKKRVSVFVRHDTKCIRLRSFFVFFCLFIIYAWLISRRRARPTNSVFLAIKRAPPIGKYFTTTRTTANSRPVDVRRV